MDGITRCLLDRWHSMLGLARHSPEWYQDRLREELQEVQEAKGPLEKLSETSDVMFAISRAQHDGYPVRQAPLPALTSTFEGKWCWGVCAYMLAKYTSRWLFYRTAASLSGMPTLKGMPQYRSVREVVNPAKDSKIEEVASRNKVDKAKFCRVARHLRRVWPLFP
ncbi:hypothetical protein PG985_014443 [Apiospora marii]|uniref:Uncharacterized protein n=1 Tax=Apiospora marii TaxID=335849 RepID=A0ABR1R500_9PEZI